MSCPRKSVVPPFHRGQGRGKDSAFSTSKHSQQLGNECLSPEVGTGRFQQRIQPTSITDQHRGQQYLLSTYCGLGIVLIYLYSFNLYTTPCSRFYFDRQENWGSERFVICSRDGAKRWKFNFSRVCLRSCPACCAL